ncbi:MAG: hypothetical protein R2774_02110 [Saprospiraceae bacterium]
MKNLKILVVLILVTLISCGKDEEPKNKIIGKWSYISLREKQTDPNDATNNNDETTFMTDDSYLEFKSDGTLESKYAEKSNNPFYSEEGGKYTVSGNKVTLIQDFGAATINIVLEMQFNSDDDVKLYSKDDSCEINFNGDIGTCESWIHLTK